MIKFFRNIRRRLLRENRFNRYLLYAIGEIILVVIGILIALQINNWNEERKLKNLEVSYYESLYQDLLQDSLEVEFKIRNAQRNIRQINNVLEFINNNYEITRTSIDSVEWPRNNYYKDTLALIHSVSQAGFVQFVDILKNTIEDLRATGGIKIIKNKDLKDDLLEYYNRDKTRENWNLALIDSRTEMEKSINKVLTSEQRTAYSREEILLLKKGDYERFVQALKATPEFQENLIGMLHLHHRIIHQSSGRLMSYITDLLAQLRNEIEKHQ
ncbi:DUF6090 family protein [Gramella sp. GC03-9]|uniref:DUF6090 family protein n=1 Tax=Christiangramia oceanisediminis TaxID=2920386 RepID=A0A9X2I6W6_9FLAO|nr:DUF6090 family protein [Gramella oceanisediminis]MCP9198591.1 DUF6090 family protein [Gramella oceanisediminis]